MKTRKSGRISLPVLTYALDQSEHSACFNPEKEPSIPLWGLQRVCQFAPAGNKTEFWLLLRVSYLLHQLSHLKNSLLFPGTWRRKRKEFSKRSSLQKKKKEERDICHCPKFHSEKLLFIFVRIIYKIKDEEVCKIYSKNVLKLSAIDRSFVFLSLNCPGTSNVYLLHLVYLCSFTQIFYQPLHIYKFIKFTH